MRQVLFKDLTSVNSRKKDIVLQEAFEKDGVLAKTERRSFYFVKEVKRLGSESNMKNWLEAQHDTQSPPKKHFHIMKEHNEKIGEDKVICKVAGTFYAVSNNNVFTIGFMHCFKVRFSKESLAK